MCCCQLAIGLYKLHYQKHICGELPLAKVCLGSNCSPSSSVYIRVPVYYPKKNPDISNSLFQSPLSLLLQEPSPKVPPPLYIIILPNPYSRDIFEIDTHTPKA